MNRACFPKNACLHESRNCGTSCIQPIKNNFERMKNLILILVFLMMVSSIGKAQTTLSGTVREKGNGIAIAGANITIKGTTIGTISDADGNYKLEAQTDTGRVIVSFIGFKTLEFPFKGSVNLSVELDVDNVNLETVMVIGYGEVKKKNLSTAVSTLDNVAEMKSRPTGISGMIQGNVAGVTVMNTGGDPGASPKMIIRGLGSPNDAPLWVVDGVPGAPVNTEDIESVTILKDAASAAIYGANVGSGGVIIVTTKKAKTGKIRVDANAYTGYQNAWKLPEALNAQELADVKNLAADNAGTSRNPAFDATQNPWGMVTRTNWVDEIFRTGKINHYALSLSGGTENLKALASFEANENEGILLNTFTKGLSGKVNIDYKLSKNIKVSQWIQAGTSRGYSNDTESGYTGAVISAIYMPPSATVYDENGKFGGVTPLDQIKYAGSYGDIVNPVASLLRKDVYNPNTWIHSTSKLEMKLLKYFTYNSSFTFGGNQYLYQEFTPKRPEPGKPNNENSRYQESSNGQHWLWENTLLFNKSFNKHSFTLLGGYSASYRKSKGFGLSVYGFDSEDEFSRNIVNGSDWTKSKPWENVSEVAYTSYFSRLSYIFDDRYYLTASVRRDATSKLYKDNNNGIFPAVSAAWKISSEPFFEVGFINHLKLRGSWGQIGNVNSVPNYSSSVKLVSQRETMLGNPATRLSGLGLESVSNLSLTWETSEQTDFGMDVDLFDSKISVVADYYIKYTKNLIDKIPIAATAGVMVAPYGNIGKVKNQGLEFSATYNGKINDFNYKIGANFATINSEVQDLGSRSIYPNDIKVRGVLSPIYSSVGQAWYSYYLVKTDGLFQTDQDAINYVDKNGARIQPNAKAGDLKFIDKTGDGIINDNDREFMGNSMPEITFGFNAYLNYKGIDLSFLFQGIRGAKLFNAFKSTTLTASEQGYNMSKDILDAWSTSNTGSSIPRISATDPNKNFQTTSDWFLEDGSYLRLKNVTLGYTLPRIILQKIGLPDASLRIYSSAENLLTITKYSGMDPEVGNYGVDVGKYPMSRIITFGANLNF